MDNKDLDALIAECGADLDALLAELAIDLDLDTILAIDLDLDALLAEYQQDLANVLAGL